MPANAPPASGRPLRSLVPRITRSTPITTTNDTPLIANAAAAPHAAITMPARNGPSARAALNCALLSVTAFSSTSRGTSSVTNDCQIGVLTPPASPDRNARADSDAMVADPDATRPHRANAHSAWPACAAINSRRRG